MIRPRKGCPRVKREISGWKTEYKEVGRRGCPRGPRRSPPSPGGPGSRRQGRWRPEHSPSGRLLSPIKTLRRGGGCSFKQARCRRTHSSLPHKIPGSGFRGLLSGVCGDVSVGTLNATRCQTTCGAQYLKGPHRAPRLGPQCSGRVPWPP